MEITWEGRIVKSILLSGLILFMGLGFWWKVSLKQKWELRKIQEWTCVRVKDGDTVVLLGPSTLFTERFQKGQRKVTVRLSFIDAPELSQTSFEGEPIGLWAQEALEKLILGKKVLFLESQEEKDPYQRTIDRLWINQWHVRNDIHLQMVREGWVLLYPFARFSTAVEKNLYLRAIELAKKRRKGLWKTQGLLSPYHFRKQVSGF